MPKIRDDRLASKAELARLRAEMEQEAAHFIHSCWEAERARDEARAEVERLERLNCECGETFRELERERDEALAWLVDLLCPDCYRIGAGKGGKYCVVHGQREALAQMAVLVKASTDLLEASALGVLDQTSTIGRLSDVLAALPTEARALLDRLAALERQR